MGVGLDVEGTDDDGTEDEGTDDDGTDDVGTDVIQVGVLLVGSDDQVGDDDDGRLLGTVVDGANVFKSFRVRSARPHPLDDWDVAISDVNVVIASH